MWYNKRKANRAVENYKVQEIKKWEKLYQN